MVVGYLLIHMLKAHMLTFLFSHTSIIDYECAQLSRHQSWDEKFNFLQSPRGAKCHPKENLGAF